MPLDASKFKDSILPLIFLKRLSDVFEDELAHLGFAPVGEKLIFVEVVERLREEADRIRGTCASVAELSMVKIDFRLDDVL